jgi:hypothetical protein
MYYNNNLPNYPIDFEFRVFIIDSDSRRRFIRRNIYSIDITFISTLHPCKASVYRYLSIYNETEMKRTGIKREWCGFGMQVTSKL